MHWIVLFMALWVWPSLVLADGGHDHHAVPTLKNQITTVDGTEALIEGFGSLSGRAARSF